MSRRWFYKSMDEINGPFTAAQMMTFPFIDRLTDIKQADSLHWCPFFEIVTELQDEAEREPYENTEGNYCKPTIRGYYFPNAYDVGDGMTPPSPEIVSCDHIIALPSGYKLDSPTQSVIDLLQGTMLTLLLSHHKSSLGVIESELKISFESEVNMAFKNSGIRLNITITNLTVSNTKPSKYGYAKGSMSDFGGGGDGFGVVEVTAEIRFFDVTANVIFDISIYHNI